RSTAAYGRTRLRPEPPLSFLRLNPASPADLGLQGDSHVAITAPAAWFRSVLPCTRGGRSARRSGRVPPPAGPRLADAARASRSGRSRLLGPSHGLEVA